MSASTTRAAVYGRESQASAASIERQIFLGTRLSDEQGWILTDTYDDGTSASRFARKGRAGWDRLRADLAAGHIDVLVLWEQSRGSRDLGEWATLLDACRDHRVLVHLTNDERTYNPAKAADRKTLLQGALDAEYETGRTSERVLSGVQEAAMNGKPPMGPVPYGYRRHRVTERDDDGHLRTVVTQEIDPDTAPHVRHAFERVAEGASIFAVARELGWERRIVLRRLRNPAYAGLRIHRRQGPNGDGKGSTTRGLWEPIVPSELFYTVQGILDEHQGAGRRPGRQRHLLSHLAVCENDHELEVLYDRWYRCRPGCVRVDKAGLDELVEATIVEALASDRWRSALKQAHEVNNEAVQAARDEVATLQARLDDYRARMRRGTMDPDDFEAIAPGLKADIEAAERAAEQVGLPPALRGFIEPGADVEARWEAAELGAKRDAIRALARIVVYPVGDRKRVPVSDRVDITPIEP